MTFARSLALAAAALLTATTGFARAAPVDPSEIKDRVEPLPMRLRGIGVEERLDTPLPLDAELVDEAGKSVRLRDFFDGKRPVVLTLNYSDCPMLCNLQLNALVEALKQIDETAGQTFEIVTLSLDPEEPPARAKETHDRYIEAYGRTAAANGWHFLTDRQGSVQTVANSVGFSYAYNEARDEWVHPAAFIVATPDGRIARYLYGIDYAPKTLRLSIVEASEGKVGSTVDRIMLYCFHYDADEGRYAPVAMNIMRLGGGVTLLGLGGFLAMAWTREGRRRKNGSAT